MLYLREGEIQKNGNKQSPKIRSVWDIKNKIPTRNEC